MSQIQTQPPEPDSGARIEVTNDSLNRNDGLLHPSFGNPALASRFKGPG